MMIHWNIFKKFIKYIKISIQKLSIIDHYFFFQLTKLKFFFWNCWWIFCSWHKSVCRWFEPLLLPRQYQLIQLVPNFQKFKTFLKLSRFRMRCSPKLESKFNDSLLKSLSLRTSKHPECIPQWLLKALFQDVWAFL